MTFVIRPHCICNSCVKAFNYQECARCCNYVKISNLANDYCSTFNEFNQIHPGLDKCNICKKSLKEQLSGSDDELQEFSDICLECIEYHSYKKCACCG